MGKSPWPWRPTYSGPGRNLEKDAVHCADLMRVSGWGRRVTVDRVHGASPAFRCARRVTGGPRDRDAWLGALLAFAWPGRLWIGIFRESVQVGCPLDTWCAVRCVRVLYVRRRLSDRVSFGKGVWNSVWRSQSSGSVFLESLAIAGLFGHGGVDARCDF
jgi:hypothetical protein